MRSVLACLIGIVLATPVVAADAVRIATLNCEFLVRSKVHIKYGLDFDRALWTREQQQEWDQPGYRDARFVESAKAVAATIHRIHADVIALSEVGNEADVRILQREVAALGLTYAHQAVCDSSDTVTGQHVAVFSKRPFEEVLKVIPGRESYDQELDDQETETTTGVSKGMKVVFRIGDRPVHFYALHLASERGGHEKDAQRIAQASVVRRHYLDPLKRGEHVIVAGDLNDQPGHPAIRRIRGRDDIEADLIQTGTVHFFDKDQLETRWTYLFQGERQQIDHILISDSISDATKRGGRIRAQTLPITEKIGMTSHLASDHRAFVLNIELR